MLILKVECNNSINGLHAIASEYSLVDFMDEICPTEVEGCFVGFLDHDHLRSPHVEPYKQLHCDTKIKPHNLS